MKKIPTVFIREFENHKIKRITQEFTSEEAREAFLHGEATVKIDGACCAIMGGIFYKRFDAKPGRMIPAGSMPCDAPDPVTGHWPHWVPVSPVDPADKWFAAAWDHFFAGFPVIPEDDALTSTYEAIGPHFNGNPYKLEKDTLVRHGERKAEVERTFEGVKEWLEAHNEEGLVFWYKGEPVCKIKRSDFGLKWPEEEEK